MRSIVPSESQAGNGDPASRCDHKPTRFNGFVEGKFVMIFWTETMNAMDQILAISFSEPKMAAR
jgi:hypothetical protein